MSASERLYARHEAARSAYERAKREGRPANIVEHLRRQDRAVVDEITAENLKAKRVSSRR